VYASNLGQVVDIVVSHQGVATKSALVSQLMSALVLPAPEHYRPLLRRLAANARKLDRLLKDLLDIDRLSRGIVSPQYRTVDLGALARRTIESLEPLADRVILAEVAPVVLTADPAKIERILENLLMNAVRHTEADRAIWLRDNPRLGKVDALYQGPRFFRHERSCPVPSLVTVTLTPGITAPAGSCTTPEICAESNLAAAGAAHKRIKTLTAMETTPNNDRDAEATSMLPPFA